MTVEVEPRGQLGQSFRLGEWLVEPSLNRISRGRTIIQLELKVMDVLVCLAERAGEVLTRQEIVDRVWATEFISDNTLTHAVTELRNALGDDARNPSFIETIHRRGYRLIAPIEQVVSDEAAVSKVATFPVPERLEERSPFPGLAAFTEADAEFFFGREDEVARMWRKLTSRRLLAVIGPSGVGKSSFIRAGVIPARPEGWGCIVCQPGEAPLKTLVRSLVPEFEGDSDAISRLVHLSRPDETAAMVSRWRDRYDHGLIVVDQFEELFTLNAWEIQEAYADVLRLLVDQADIHLLLSMRDDFLYRCQKLEPLQPVLDGLYALDPPSRGNLERALVEPAHQLGYTFEDDLLAREMVEEAEGERGALPLTAFAMARLWDARDRDNKLLTRQAYQDIGGVGGALARHAENALKSIGSERVPVVREIFRNLVTSQGTRAVREVENVLSVFPAQRRFEADGVLRRLIDARLLTSFEEVGVDGLPSRRVEVVHESLLSSWPRLVRWQTQDTDAAQLRDQVRQATRTWDEHDRARDYLWTGKAYREFVVWSENYPGGLTELEEDFGKAMTAYAKRRKRRRRFAVSAAFVVLVAVLGVVGVSRQQAIAEANRAEAQKLLALGQLELETDPAVALAWARASLELHDTREGRLFVLKCLAQGPIARVLPLGLHGRHLTFSPDGEWLAFQGLDGFTVHRRSGGPAAFRDSFQARGRGKVWPLFDVAGRHLTVAGMGKFRSYAVPDFVEVARGQLADPSERELMFAVPTGRGAILASAGNDGLTFELLKSESTPILLLQTPDLACGDIDAAGEWAACFKYGEGRRRVYLQSLVDPTLPPRFVHESDKPFADFTLHPDLDWIAIPQPNSGTVGLWRLEAEASEPVRTLDCGDLQNVSVLPHGPRVVAAGMQGGNPRAFVWDLRAPVEADPLVLRTRAGSGKMYFVYGDPTGKWLVAPTGDAVFWPLPSNPVQVYSGYSGQIGHLTFTPDNKALVIPQFEYANRGLRVQTLVGGEESRLLLRYFTCWMARVDPEGRFVVVSSGTPRVALCPLDGSEPTWLEGFGESVFVRAIAHAPERSLVAAGAFRGPPEEKVIRVWNLGDGSVQVLGPTDEAGDVHEGGYRGLAFLPDGSLLSESDSSVRRWRLDNGSSELLFADGSKVIGVPADGRMVVAARESGQIDVLDLEKNELRQAQAFPGQVEAGALSPDGELIAVGDLSGAVMVRRLAGSDPYVLFGHEGPIQSVAFSPDGRWLASVDRGGTVRVWPVPDLSKPPLHALPRPEFFARLDEFTNLRIVRDEESPTGWKLTHDPFPGWETVPSW